MRYVLVQAQPSFDWLTHVASVLIGLFVGIFTEPFRAWLFRPAIRLSFRKDEHFMRETPVNMSAGEAVYRHSMLSVRFKVENTRRFHARSCRAFLTLIEKRGSDARFIVVFEDRVPLKWSYLSCDAIEIPGKTFLYCDIFGSTEDQKELVPACCDPKPPIFDELFRPKTVYRFTALVTAKNCAPVSIRLCADWKGTWRIDDIWQDEAGRKSWFGLLFVKLA
jgi:hypothetical protein